MIDTPSEINEFQMNKKQEERSEDYDYETNENEISPLALAGTFICAKLDSRCSVGSE